MQNIEIIHGFKPDPTPTTHGIVVMDSFLTVRVDGLVVAHFFKDGRFGIGDDLSDTPSLLQRILTALGYTATVLNETQQVQV
jgi:hypothetical protein